MCDSIKICVINTNYIKFCVIKLNLGNSLPVGLVKRVLVSKSEHDSSKFFKKVMVNVKSFHMGMAMLKLN